MSSSSFCEVIWMKLMYFDIGVFARVLCFSEEDNNKLVIYWTPQRKFVEFSQIFWSGNFVKTGWFQGFAGSRPYMSQICRFCKVD